MIASTLNSTKINAAAPNKKKQQIRTATDTLTRTDSVARIVKHSRGFADTLSQSDSLSKHQILLRALASASSAADSIVKSLRFIRTDSDTFTFSDSATRGATGTVVSASDVFTFSDSLARVVILARGLADTESTSDSMQRSGSRFISDVISFSDSIVRALSLNPTITDSDILAESIARSLQLVDNIVDSESFADFVQSTHPIGKVTDTFNFSDSIQKICSLIRVQAGHGAPQVFVDIVQHNVNLGLVISDSNPEYDQINLPYQGTRNITDTFLFSDTTGAPIGVRGSGSVKSDSGSGKVSSISSTSTSGVVSGSGSVKKVS